MYEYDYYRPLKWSLWLMTDDTFDSDVGQRKVVYSIGGMTYYYEFRMVRVLSGKGL